MYEPVWIFLWIKICIMIDHYEFDKNFIKLPGSEIEQSHLNPEKS